MRGAGYRLRQEPPGTGGPDPPAAADPAARHARVRRGDGDRAGAHRRGPLPALRGELDETINHGPARAGRRRRALPPASAGGALRGPPRRSLDRDESFAQVLGLDGTVLDASPSLHDRPLLTAPRRAPRRRAGRRSSRDRTRSRRTSPRGCWRCRYAPRAGAARRRRHRLRRSRRGPAPSLLLLPDRRPGGAAAGVARRLRRRLGRARPRRADAPQGRRDHRPHARRAAAGGPHRRRDRPARHDAEHDARTPRALLRARARLRRRRLARAAHAAGDPQDRDRARAARAAARRTSSSRRCGPPARRPTVSPSWPRLC